MTEVIQQVAEAKKQKRTTRRKCTQNPSNKSAKLIPVVEEITPEIEALAGGAGSSLGTGGMLTKISAAKRATSAGADMIITNGARADVLYDIVEGKPVGTRFIGKKEHAQ